jgi:hypothetical protein
VLLVDGVGDCELEGVCVTVTELVGVGVTVADGDCVREDDPVELSDCVCDGVPVGLLLGVWDDVGLIEVVAETVCEGELVVV